MHKIYLPHPITIVQYNCMNALRQLGYLDSAISVFRNVENRKDEPLLSTLSQYQIYDIFYIEKKFPESIFEARKLVEKYPSHPKAEIALYDIGWANKEMNKQVESSQAFLELIERYPNTDLYSKALYQLGQNSFELKKYSEAIAYWTTLGIKFKPASFKDQDWEKVQLKAVKERQIFEASSARENEASVLELVAKAQVKVGDCYRDLDNYDSAMTSYRKVVTNYSLIPSLVEVTYNKMAAMANEKRGLAEGEKIYRIAIDENFANKELQAKFQYKIADTYQNANQFAKAAEEYEFYSRAYSDVASIINFSVEDAMYLYNVCLYNADKYPEAITGIESYIEKYPESSYLYDLKYIKAVCLFTGKNFDKAELAFKDVIELQPEGPRSVASKVYLGRGMMEAKKEKEAADYFRNLLAEYPGHQANEEMYYFYISACYETKQYDSIPAAFLKMKPGTQYYVSSIIKSAKSFTLQKKYAEGEKFIKKITALADSLKDSTNFKPEAYFSLADLNIATSKFADGVQNLSVVINDPKTNEMLKLQSRYLKGTLLGQLSKYKESIEELEPVLANPTFLERFKPQLANARGRLATAYTKNGQLQKGVDMMNRYISETTDSIEKARYIVALAEVFFEIKNYDKIIPYGEQIVAMGVNDDFLYSRAVYLTATAYNAKNNIDKALGLFKKSVEKYPEMNQDVFFNFCVSLYDMQYFANASLAFNLYVEKYPTAPSAKNAMFFSAYSHYKLGEWDSSVTAFRNFIKKYPEDAYAAESQYNIAEARYNASNFNEAIKEYIDVYTKYPKSDFAAPAVYNEAWANYQLKDMDKMIVPLQKLIKDYPQSPLVAEAQFTVGDYFYNKKDYSKALYEYRTFIEKFPNHIKTEEARSFIKELSQIDAFKDYQKAIIQFDKKNWKQAITELSAIVEKYPETEIAMACEANVGSAYEQLQNPQKALEVFKSIITKYKTNELAAGVVYFAQQHIEWIEGNATAGK
ncbi:MAG: tetratricopeptide repeat protein [Ignavibacteriales bacterium]|nr:tetratricopeptide repeat protein [Ignavibacteriales bacterium]